MKDLLLFIVPLIAFACTPAETVSTNKTVSTATPPSNLNIDAQDKSSMDYVREGSAFYMAGEYKKSISPYQKALDLEKKERKLERKLWIVLVDNLGMAYGMTGDIKSSQEVFQYGISKEPTYPLFYYNMACGYGELGDEENAIKYLRPAFKHKANMLGGEKLPDPMSDSSFAKFKDSETFKREIAALKNSK